jgi:hypothetical protein
MPDTYEVGSLYAVLHDYEWHLARWDGGAFDVVSTWQSGDRWKPEMVERVVLVDRV